MLKNLKKPTILEKVNNYTCHMCVTRISNNALDLNVLLREIGNDKIGTCQKCWDWEYNLASQYYRNKAKEGRKR